MNDKIKLYADFISSQVNKSHDISEAKISKLPSDKDMVANAEKHAAHHDELSDHHHKMAEKHGEDSSRGERHLDLGDAHAEIADQYRSINQDNHKDHPKIIAAIKQIHSDIKDM
jgi:hypothetical protein